VWLDGGTTIYFVAEALADRRPEGLVVVTHNMPAAELLADLGDVDVHLLGGQYFRRTSLLLGPRTVTAARRWRFDVALLGVEGIDRSGLWNSLRDVVLLQRAVLRESTLSVVCADAVKIGRRVPRIPLSGERRGPYSQRRVRVRLRRRGTARSPTSEHRP